MFSNIPTGLWIRILILLYKAKNYIRIFLRFLGLTLKLSWSEFNLSIKIICFPVSRFNPDIVVGIGVGGTILGATIAGNLNKKFIAIDREANWNNERSVNLIDNSITEERIELMKSKRILLTSAEIVTGMTTKMAEEYVKKFNPTEIKIACIDYNPISSVITPDYYYLTTHEIIQKPWRLLKSYNSSEDNQRV